MIDLYFQEMLKANPTSLNSISYDAVVRALRRIVSSTGGEYDSTIPQITDVFVDTVGDPEFYKSRLTQALGENFANFIIEKKADAKFKVVSAASIIAKVTRDTIIENWIWAEGSAAANLDTKFGSGYPGDEACVQW
jgi:ribonuclease H2 subunit A